MGKPKVATPPPTQTISRTTGRQTTLSNETTNQNQVTNSTQTVAPNAGGLALLNQLVPQAQALQNFQVGNVALSGISQDALKQFQGLNFQEAQDALAAIEQFAGKDFSASSQVNPLLLEAAQGKFLTTESGNPFLEDFIRQQQRLTAEAFNTQVLPGIASQFAGTGGFNSSTRGAVTAANARDLQRTLGDIATTTSFNVFEAERGRQLQAQELLAQIEQANSDRTLSALGLQAETAGGIGQLNLSRIAGIADIGAQQNQINLQNVVNQINANNSRVGALNAAAGLVPLFGTTTTGSTTTNTTTNTTSKVVNKGVERTVSKTSPVKSKSSNKAPKP